jgi:hypothetical protein
MFSLCIPTIDRFDTFLNSYLEKYLTNDLIDEIIICDENGNDYNKIINAYQDSPKIKAYKNESILGPFLNKLKACNLASNEWIVLIDSDNFADKDYFQTAKEYINNTNISKNSILSPCHAKPNFNYKTLQGNVYNKTNMFNNECLANTGNYIINKYIIDNLDISKELENIKQSAACDVIFFNTLLFEQFDLQFHVVKGMEYNHVVHDGSVYLNNCNLFKNFNEYVYKRYRLLNL